MLKLVNKKYKKKIGRGFFVTGTDTDVGKTLIAASMSLALINSGKRVCAIKPVASGCSIQGKKLSSDDALMLQKYSNCSELSYPDINPFSFRDPVAPHLAAKKKGIKLTVAQILKKSETALTSDADYIIIEGAGGWYTPLSEKEYMADLARAYGYPIILVVGVRLGCLNQAILTYKCMLDSKVKVAGWVANVIDKNMLYLKENIESLKINIKAPLLGVIPYVNRVDPKKVFRFLELKEAKILKKPHQKRKFLFFPDYL